MKTCGHCSGSPTSPARTGSGNRSSACAWSGITRKIRQYQIAESFRWRTASRIASACRARVSDPRGSAQNVTKKVASSTGMPIGVSCGSCLRPISMLRTNRLKAPDLIRRISRAPRRCAPTGRDASPRSDFAGLARAIVAGKNSRAPRRCAPTTGRDASPRRPTSLVWRALSLREKKSGTPAVRPHR